MQNYDTGFYGDDWDSYITDVAGSGYDSDYYSNYLQLWEFVPALIQQQLQYGTPDGKDWMAWTTQDWYFSYTSYAAAMG